MLRFAYGVLADILLVDAVLSRAELNLAVAIIANLTQNRLSREEIENDLLLAPTLENDVGRLSEEFRRTLLRAAVAAAFADSHVVRGEMAYLGRLATLLKIPHGYLRNLVAEFTGERQQPANSPPANVKRALEILGLSSDASAPAIKAAYRSRILKFHPDRAGFDEKKRAEYHRMAQELNWAFDELERQRSAAG
jgi:DnaJ-domain-containing protein 1